VAAGGPHPRGPPRDPAQGGGRPLALTDHDDAEDEVADLLQELGPDGQQQPGHRLHPAHGRQEPARLRRQAQRLQREDLGEADELRLLPRARGSPEPGLRGTAPPGGVCSAQPRTPRASALHPKGLSPVPQPAQPPQWLSPMPSTPT